MSVFKCCIGCEPMGSMCDKHNSEPDYLHPQRQNHQKKQEEVEVQPLIQQKHASDQNKKEKHRSPTPSSDASEEDKQLLHDEIIHDAEDDDDNNQLPEYSKNEDIVLSDDNNKQLTPESNHNDNELNEAKHRENIDDVEDNGHCKEDEQKIEIIVDKKYALPSSLGGIPIESTQKMDDEDKQFALEIRRKYATKLKQHPLDNMNFVGRYTLGYKHIKRKKRMEAVCKDIDYFFEMYQQYNMDHIIETKSTEQELNAWKQFLYGEDKYGHPIMYDLIGSSDCKEMKRVFMDNDKPFGQSCYEHVFRFMRKAENYKRQNTLKYGKQIHKQIQIMDMKGFTADHIKGKNRKLVKLVVGTLTRMFPEGTYKMFIINAPWPFRAAWVTVKAFLDPITAKKTKVLGEDYLKEMVKDIPIEMIPTNYGGKGVWEIRYGDVPKNYPIDVYHGLD